MHFSDVALDPLDLCAFGVGAMSSKRRRPLRRKDELSGDLRMHELPRWSLPLPPDRQAELPFVYDPSHRAVIAPWPRGPVLSMADERRLYAVLDRIAALD